MTSTLDAEIRPTEVDEAESTRSFERLIAAAQPSAVFSEPITVGDTIVITAREVTVAGGYGFGGGFGPSQEPTGGGTSVAAAGGKGGGGGGVASGRPLAVITISPQGIKVKPILDVTKVLLSAIGVAQFVSRTIAKLSKQRMR